MAMRALTFAVAMFALSASAAELSADENLVSERLSSRAMGVLDGMFGPGRAKVLVEVRGERMQIHTATEIVTPMSKPGSSSAVKGAMRMFDLPGYYKEREVQAAAAAKEESAASRAIQPFQKDLETSLRDAGFEIKKIEATAVLDSTLTETEARDAAQLLPQLLRIDGTRGDVLTIVRAPMRPAWKTAFSTPGDWRKLAFIASGLLVALLIVMIISSAFVRGARVFAKELTKRGGGQGGGDSGELGDPLPELMPGSPAGLVEAEGVGEDAEAGAFPALGRRFDFLETADAAGAARVLADQPPIDLAQIFAYLAKIAPETASRMFSKLPADIQAEASASLLKLKTVDPERLSEIEDKLRSAIANGLRGSERLATILSRFPGEERAMLLGKLASREDSRSVEEVERMLFSFEDFVTLSAADLRRVMSAVPYELWGTALRGAPETLINNILSELPDGPRNLVREESLIPHPKDKVVAARSKILDTFLDLAAKGQITLDRGAGAEETL